MDGINLKQANQSLSIEQQKVIASKKINGNYKPRNLVKLLKPLVVFDRVNDGVILRLGRWCNMLSLILSLIFVGYIIYAAVTESLEFLIYVLPAFILLLIIRVYLGRKRGECKTRDLEDDLRKFLFPFAMLMQDELKVGTKLLVDVDADVPTRAKYLSNGIRRKNRYGCSYRYYSQPWFSARGVFADQSQFSIECEKRATEIDIIKRSASGKTKHKSKFKLSHIVKIKMLIPRDQYARSAILDRGAIAVEEVDGYFAIKAKYKHKTNKIETLNLEKVLGLIYHMYSMVKPKS